jgi:hypothetical protein
LATAAAWSTPIPDQNEKDFRILSGYLEIILKFSSKKCRNNNG